MELPATSASPSPSSSTKPNENTPDTIQSSSSNKRPSGKARGPPAKRPRFNNTQGARRGGAAYTKEQPSTGLTTKPVRLFFPTFTSTKGALSFVQSVYQWCVGRDYRWAQSVQLCELQYVSLLAMIYRFLQLGQSCGYYFDPMTSYLKQITQGIYLPDPICKMIEACGIVKRPGMPTVVPLCVPWDQYRRLRRSYADPRPLFREYLPEPKHVPRTSWAIDPEWVTEYMDHCARAEGRSMGFRPIKWDVPEGRVEMLYGYRHHAGMFAGDLEALGPSEASQQEAQLGAVYAYRDHDQQRRWPAAPGNHLVRGDYFDSHFTAGPFIARLCGDAVSTSQRT